MKTSTLYAAALLLLGCAGAAANLDPCKVCASIRDHGCPVITADPEKIPDESVRNVAVDYCEKHGDQ